jgi:hypothetical protein
MCKRLFLFASLLFLFNGIVYAQPEQKLAAAFIQSVSLKKFDLLAPYIANEATMKSIAPKEFSKKTPAAMQKMQQQYYQRLKTSWQTCVERAKAAAIDFTLFDRKEAVLYQPFPSEYMKGLIITYDYRDTTWDDISLMVVQQNGKIFLLDVPMPSRMFTMNAAVNGKEIARAKASLTADDPKVFKLIEAQVRAMFQLAKEGKGREFARYVVCTVDGDKLRQWKAPADYNNEAEKLTVDNMLERMAAYVTNCADYRFEPLKTEKESEGTWYPVRLTCSKPGAKDMVLAFLKVGEAFLLGDID